VYRQIRVFRRRMNIQRQEKLNPAAPVVDALPVAVS
jgi:hypothetical protein